ncbi:MAG: hypothetical protein QM490_02470 [Candidatus Gracilibacteria bacterium]
MAKEGINKISGEEGVDAQKNNKNNTVIKDKIIKKICKDQMDDKSKKNDFLDRIFVDKENPNDLIKEEFRADKFFNGGKDEYKLVSPDIIKLSDFKNKLATEFVILKNRRDQLEKIIIGDYNVDDNELLKISGEILKLDDDKLTDFIISDKKRNAFLKTIIGNGLSYRTTKSFPTLNSLTKEQFDKKIKDLSNEEKKNIKEIFNEIKIGIISDTNLKILIEGNFLTDIQKKEIVENLIATITLKQAKELGFLTDIEIKERKEVIIEKYLGDTEGITDKKKKEILVKIKDENIIISSKEFITNDENIVKLSERIGFKSFEDDYKEYVKDMKNTSVKEGPQSFDEFKNELSSLTSMNSGIENLVKNSVVKITTVTITGKDEIYREEYFKINDFGDTNISMTFIGSRDSNNSKTLISKKGEKEKTESYADFLGLLNTTDTKGSKSILDIYDEAEFDEKIKDKKKYTILIKNLDNISKEDLIDNDELQEKLKNELQETYKLQLNELEEELTLLNEERDRIKDDPSKKNEYEALQVKINLLENLINDKNDDITGLGDGSLSEEDRINYLVEHNNFNDLLEKIDSLDPEGKRLGFRKGIIIESCHGKSKGQLFEVIGINNSIEGSNFDETIVLKSHNGAIETIRYESFFQNFKDNKVKRIEKINTFDKLLINNGWNDEYEVKNSDLVQKSVVFNGKTKDKTIEYLVSEKGDLIKIESIGNNEVEVFFGEYSEGTENKRTKKTNNKIKLDSSSSRLSLNELSKLIKDNKYLPDWKIGKNYTFENIDGYQNDITPNFLTKFVSRASIKELMLGGKMIIDGIEDYFKRGNEVMAAELALKMSILMPKDMGEDFMAQTEMKSAEAMDKELTALGKIASGPASERVLRWLKNKNTPEYKKEAGLLFVSKYGILYPKELSEYNGSFLWYEALGGRIGDARYEKEKLKAGKSGLPFDEKELLIGFLGGQSLGYEPIKRRSKFYKEFKGKMAGGFSEEYSDGYKDAKDKRKLGDLNEGGFGEMEGNTIPNAIGWAKRAAEKGGSLKEMNEIYFTLIFSGALYNIGSNTLEKLKDHWTLEGNGMIFSLFGSTLTTQKIFNKTVLSVSKEIEKVEGGKYGGISTKANEIFDLANNTGKNFKEKIEKTRDFWETYGEVLSRTLHMTDDKDVSFAKTDKIIAFGKDSEYKDYYNFIKKGTALPTAFKEDFMEDDVGLSGVTGLDNFEIIKKYYKVDTSRAFRSQAQKVIEFTWGTIWTDIVSVKDKIEASPENANNYKIYLHNKLREVSAGLLAGAGKEYISTLDVVDPCGLDLSSIGIVLSDFKSNRVSDVLEGNVGNEIFDKAVENIISGSFSKPSGLGKSNIFGTIDYTKKAADDAVYE